jgi:hypothetical protein
MLRLLVFGSEGGKVFPENVRSPTLPTCDLYEPDPARRRSGELWDRPSLGSSGPAQGLHVRVRIACINCAGAMCAR